MAERKIKVLCIVGPTASGKTALSVKLAKILNGEIISADSMQIYKCLDIGTAKVTQAEMDGVVHHMVDFVEPNVNFSLSEYVNYAKEIINDINKRGKTVIICGGTGLYVDTLLSGTKLSDAAIDTDYREYLNNILAEKGKEHLYSLLKQADEQAASRIHSNDAKRVMRALEVIKSTGRSICEWDELSKVDSPYDVCYIGLNYTDRELLYNKINSRVDSMVKSGLVEEAKTVMKMNLPPQSTAMQAICYKEIFEYLNGNMTLQQAIELLKMQSRRYAKRQLTWFRKNKHINWIYVDEHQNIEEIVNYVKNIWKNM